MALKLGSTCGRQGHVGRIPDQWAKGGHANVQEVGSFQGGTDSQFAGGAWDPTDSSRLASIGGRSIQVSFQTTIQVRALCSSKVPRDPCDLGW